MALSWCTHRFHSYFSCGREKESASDGKSFHQHLIISYSAPYTHPLGIRPMKGILEDQWPLINSCKCSLGESI